MLRFDRYTYQEILTPQKVSGEARGCQHSAKTPGWRTRRHRLFGRIRHKRGGALDARERRDYGKPGPIVMLRGLHTFRAIQLGWTMAGNV
jgi:hypothetical protein